MAVWKLWFVLLLLLPAYNNSQGTVQELVFIIYHLRLPLFSDNICFKDNKIFSLFHTDLYDWLFAVTLVKTTGREPYVTPICTNETLNIITLIICKIRTERSRGEECLLTYKYGEKFFNGCDSRFTLMRKNQNIFLHLTSLTPVGSGNYSCECTYPEGTNTLHHDITVEGKHVMYFSSYFD